MKTNKTLDDIQEDLTVTHGLPVQGMLASMHDRLGNLRYDSGSGQIDCKYPIFEPHVILAEMKQVRDEIREMYDKLRAFGVTE